jgi:hypothetical protein
LRETALAPRISSRRQWRPERKEKNGMPLTETDLLDALDDPALGFINFSLGGVVQVSRQKFGVIREHILAGNILVTSWNEKHAKYVANDPPVLYMQNDTSPASTHARALLLHECTHAIVHVFAVKFGELDNEVTAYLLEVAYLLVKNPHYATAPNNPPWFKFFDDCLTLVKKRGLNLGGYQLVSFKEVKPLEDQMPSLPGGFYKDDASRTSPGTGLKEVKPFIPTNEPVSERVQFAAHETYPDPGDGYLADLLGRRYAKDDVAGYGARVRELEAVFRRLSKGKAISLYPRLAVRAPGDEISIAFHDHLSTITRTRMLAIVRSRM